MRRGLCVLLLAMASFFVGTAQITLSSLSQEWVVEPGGSYQGSVQVTNPAEIPVTVEISLSDYTFNCQGENHFLPPGSLPRSNASWIKLGIAARITIPPKATITIPYTIHVPKDEDLKGTYWSVIIVRYIPPETEQVGNVSIKQIFQYAVHVVTDIEDTGERKIEILDIKKIFLQGKPFLQFDVANTGERWLRPEVWLEVYDEEGNFVGKFDSKSGKLRIYPGTSVRHIIPLPTSLKPGTYPSLIYLDNGDAYIWAVEFTIESK